MVSCDTAAQMAVAHTQKTSTHLQSCYSCLYGVLSMLRWHSCSSKEVYTPRMSKVLHTFNLQETLDACQDSVQVGSVCSDEAVSCSRPFIPMFRSRTDKRVDPEATATHVAGTEGDAPLELQSCHLQSSCSCVNSRSLHLEESDLEELSETQEDVVSCVTATHVAGEHASQQVSVDGTKIQDQEMKDSETVTVEAHEDVVVYVTATHVAGACAPQHGAEVSGIGLRSEVLYSPRFYQS